MLAELCGMRGGDRALLVLALPPPPASMGNAEPGDRPSRLGTSLELTSPSPSMNDAEA
eukprot:CAMPEP_0196601716 /NCGR_PEP_ID=MMETSP1081-20130531/96054_1 /TAXON_ID=36882 /ORGANISM="Pyramimonas amylifera, Strain CCMP720" /LENGTH=57 /DNA_ID=CAMNT_0041927603 /DNA_START=631 /DNA_END=804 /DNA_ORIENTATION=+